MRAVAGFASCKLAPFCSHHTSSPYTSQPLVVGRNAVDAGLAVPPYALQSLQYDGDAAAKLLVGSETLRRPRRCRQ